jgi:spermidine synthase
VQSDFFDPSWFEGATDWLDPHKVRQRASELDAAPNAQVSTDLHPVVYLQRLGLWEKMTAGQGRRVIEWLRSVRWYELVGVLLVLAGVTMLACYISAHARGPRPGPGVRSDRIDDTPEAPGHAGLKRQWLANAAVVLSVGSTGFGTMALSIIWLFAFQNLYGYVYQRIGWIIAVFMGGLVVGCELVNRRSKRLGGQDRLRTFFWRWLILVDMMLALLAATAPFVLTGLGKAQGGPLAFTLVEWCVSIMVALTGVLGGAAFPLAAGLQTGRTARSGAVAGVVVGADHAGACLGALLCGIHLVPVFGTAAAAALLAGMKLASAGLLVLARKSDRHLL